MRNIRRLIVIAATMGLLPGSACTALAAQRDDTSFAQRQTLTHNGITRSYVVRIPREQMQGSARVPLVLVLHGGGGNALNAERMSGFTQKARAEGFIVVYPEGTSRFEDKLLTWNAGHCCGYAMKNRVDDVGFINALLDKLIAEYPVDPKRIYATGISNGGMMTHRLGIELSNRFAAIAPVVATLFGDEARPAYPVSALMFNGMQDKSVPYLGGTPGGRFTDAWDGKPTKPAAEQGTFWAEADGCAKPPEQQDRGTSAHWQYHCPAGKAVELYLVKDSGHAWPGGQAGSRKGDTPSSSLNATDLIWEFFRTHAK